MTHQNKVNFLTLKFFKMLFLFYAEMYNFTRYIMPPHPTLLTYLRTL